VDFAHLIKNAALPAQHNKL